MFTPNEPMNINRHRAIIHRHRKSNPSRRFFVAIFLTTFISIIIQPTWLADACSVNCCLYSTLGPMTGKKKRVTFPPPNLSVKLACRCDLYCHILSSSSAFSNLLDMISNLRDTNKTTKNSVQCCHSSYKTVFRCSLLPLELLVRCSLI